MNHVLALSELLNQAEIRCLYIWLISRCQLLGEKKKQQSKLTAKGRLFICMWKLLSSRFRCSIDD